MDPYDELHKRHGAPEELPEEYLHERLKRLEGWREDADEIMREANDWQEELERLAATMTEDERQATEELFATVVKQLIGIARKQYESESPSDLPFRDVKGALYPIFLRVLVGYDPEKSHLTTHIHIRSREHIRRYIRWNRRSQTAGNTEQMRRLRTLVRQEDSAIMAEKGRPATLDELVAAASDRAFLASDEKLRRRFRAIREEQPARSVDEPIGDSADGRTLGQTVEAGSPRSRPGVRAMGERVAEITGYEDVWEVLAGSVEESESPGGQ